MSPQNNWLNNVRQIRKKNLFYFDHYDPDALHDILDTQHKIAQLMKNRGDKNMFQILCFIDDFADDP